jgi:hypothetical protein
VKGRKSRANFISFSLVFLLFTAYLPQSEAQTHTAVPERDYPSPRPPVRRVLPSIPLPDIPLIAESKRSRRRDLMKSSNVRETLPKGAWTTLVRRTVLIGGERTRKDSEKSGTRRRLRWRRKGEGEQEKVAGGCALSYEWIGRATGRSATRGVRVKTDHSSLLILTFPPTHLHSTYLLQPLPSHSPTHNASRSRSTPLYRP